METGEMLVKAKIEARWETTDTALDAYIIGLFTEILRNHTALQFCDELLVTDVAGALSTGSGTFAAPTDIQHVLNVRFARDANTPWLYLDQWNRNQRPTLNGYPRYWRRQGTNIIISPFSEVQAAHLARLDYYKFAAPFNPSVSTAFPVPKLENVVLQETVHRMMRYGNDPRLAIVASDAQRAHSASYASN